MFDFKHWSLRQKLMLLPALFTIAVLGLVGLAVQTLHTVKIQGPLYQKILEQKELNTDTITPELSSIKTRLLNVTMFTAQTPEELEELVREAAKVREELEASYQKWADRLPEGRQRELIETIRNETLAYIAKREETFVAHLRKGDLEAARDALIELRPAFARIDEAATELDALNAKVAQEQEALAAATVVSKLTMMVVSGLICLLLVGFVSWLILRNISEIIATLIGEARRLTGAATEGRLEVRADPAAIAGEFRPIVVGINEILDAVITPLRESARYVSEISQGRIPPPITESARGEFERLKTELNNLIEVLQRRKSDVDLLLQAALEGNLQQRVDAQRYSGENRALFENLNAMLDAMAQPLVEISRVQAALAVNDLRPRVTGSYHGAFDELKRSTNQVADAFTQAVRLIGDNTTALASSAEELTAVTRDVNANAGHTSQQASMVSAASEQVSKNVQTVSMGAHEMSASIKEIAKNASEAARVANEAVEATRRTHETIGKLDQSSAAIGRVVKLITSIAEQTNLLALNATIEAARAGEAGKGFAVVANEVKDLATETARATEDIGNQVSSIQVETRAAVEAIAQISTVMQRINDISSTIASAVEEQSATTAEIGQNVTEAAHGVSDIAANIGGVAKVAQDTAQATNDARNSAAELARIAADLQSLVGQFKLEQEGGFRPRLVA